MPDLRPARPDEVLQLFPGDLPRRLKLRDPDLVLGGKVPGQDYLVVQAL